MILVRSWNAKTVFLQRRRNAGPGPFQRLRAMLGSPAFLFWFSLLIAQTLYFSYSRDIHYVFVLAAFPSALLAGAFFCWFRCPAEKIFQLIDERTGRPLALFLLFFLFVISHFFLFSIVFSFPLCLVIERVSVSSALAGDYSLYSANCILAIAIVNWAMWMSRSEVLGFRRCH